MKIFHRLQRTLESFRAPREKDSGSMTPRFGEVQFGDLRRLTPISNIYGYDRGLPVDRYYIEGFLRRNAYCIRGNVLEVKDNQYTREFGGNKVLKSDVLHAEAGNPDATIVADLASADQIPSQTFDCIILTQTLQLIYDLKAAVQTLYRILKPSGVLLATFPGISQIDVWEKTKCWSLTELSANQLFESVFGASSICVESYGNVLASIAFLQGIAAEELDPEELEFSDPCFPLSLCVKAIRDEKIPANELAAILESKRIRTQIKVHKKKATTPFYPSSQKELASQNTATVDYQHLFNEEADRIRQELLDPCKVVQNRESVLPLLPKKVIAAELGVLGGDWSDLLLRYLEPSELHLIDLFNSPDWPWVEPKRFEPATHLEFMQKKFEEKSNVKIHQGDSISILNSFPDEYFDLLYIDSDHRYEHVMGELLVAKKKIKPGGYIMLNDYIVYDYANHVRYGVVRAVNEFMNRFDYAMEYFALTPHLYCDVVLKKKGSKDSEF